MAVVAITAHINTDTATAIPFLKHDMVTKFEKPKLQVLERESESDCVDQ